MCVFWILNETIGPCVDTYDQNFPEEMKTIFEIDHAFPIDICHAGGDDDKRTKYVYAVFSLVSFILE